MGDGLKCNHPLTRGCRVDVICDLCVSFASKCLLHQFIIGGCIFGGGVFLVLFMICARHLLVSN